MKLEVTDWNPAKTKILLGKRDLTKTNSIAAVVFGIVAGGKGSRAQIFLNHIPLKADVKVLEILDNELNIPAILW